jgi:hypothetical protein
MESGYNGQRWTRWFLSHEGVKPCEIFIAVYLQSVGRKRVHTALCSPGYGASTVARKLYRQLSITGVTTPVKNGTVKPSGSSEGDGSDI